MKTISSHLQTHIFQDVTTLALCWRVHRNDGVVIRGTDHDQDIEVNSGGDNDGTYYAAVNITGSNVKTTSDLAVDNLEVTGAVDDTQSLIEVSPSDIEAGLLDNAEVYIFAVDWADPTGGEIVLRRGTLGVVSRNADGMYQAELRGMTQPLAQQILRTYSQSCDAELGDARCKVNVAAYQVSGTVAAVTSRREFEVSLSFGSSGAPANGFYTGGKLTFTSGDNDGYAKEVKVADINSAGESIILFEPMPADVQIGDTFDLVPGCDKSLFTCRDVFMNLDNFRGYGVYTPTQNEVLKYGGQ